VVATTSSALPTAPLVAARPPTDLNSALLHAQLGAHRAATPTLTEPEAGTSATPTSVNVAAPTPGAAVVDAAAEKGVSAALATGGKADNNADIAAIQAHLEAATRTGRPPSLAISDTAHVEPSASHTRGSVEPRTATAAIGGIGKRKANTGKGKASSQRKTRAMSTTMEQAAENQEAKSVRKGKSVKKRKVEKEGSIGEGKLSKKGKDKAAEKEKEKGQKGHGIRRDTSGDRQGKVLMEELTGLKETELEKWREVWEEVKFLPTGMWTVMWARGVYLPRTRFDDKLGNYRGYSSSGDALHHALLPVLFSSGEGRGRRSSRARTVPAGSGCASRPRPYFVPLLEQVLGLPPSPSPAPPLECPQPVQSQSLLQPVSPLPAPSPYTGPTGGLAERRAPASRPASPARPACTSRRTSRPRPPAVPGTHQMALRPSTAPLRVPLPSPPATSLPAFPDPESDSLRAASPTVARFLATVVTDPSLASTAASALVAELVDFAASCRLDYAASLVAESASVCPPSVGGECALSTDVLEDRQEDQPTWLHVADGLFMRNRRHMADLAPARRCITCSTVAAHPRSEREVAGDPVGTTDQLGGDGDPIRRELEVAVGWRYPARRHTGRRRRHHTASTSFDVALRGPCSRRRLQPSRLNVVHFIGLDYSSLPRRASRTAADLVTYVDAHVNAAFGVHRSRRS
ncbi:unnamed protein product, partial [Closterium sp. NIES-53]